VPVRDVFRLPVDNPALRRVMAVVVLFVLGHFGAYTFIRPFLEANSAAAPAFVTVLLMIYGVGGAAGNVLAGFAVAHNVRTTFVVGGAGLVASLLLLLALGDHPVGVIVGLALWGVSFGVVQLCQLTMTQAAAPDAFEAAMSLNTLAYNTSIALGAFFGGLFADHLGVTSVFWYGVALTAASLLLVIRSARPAGRRVGSATP
jgi:predicted MFS family arabinose efflux permease